MLELSRRMSPQYPELERLVCVALSNQRFASLLLTTPEAALDIGHHGFQLSPAERTLVASINGATDIHDFAARLYVKMQQSRRDSLHSASTNRSERQFQPIQPAYSH